MAIILSQNEENCAQQFGNVGQEIKVHTIGFELDSSLRVDPGGLGDLMGLVRLRCVNQLMYSALHTLTRSQRIMTRLINFKNLEHNFRLDWTGRSSRMSEANGNLK